MKKINCIYSIVFIVSLLSANAQDSLGVSQDTVKVEQPSSSTSKPFKSTLGIAIYSSTPMGVFKSTDFNNLTSGYAKNGYGAGINYSYNVFQSFVVKASLTYMRNTVNSKIIAEQILTTTAKQTALANMYSSATATYWENYSVTAGFSYQLWLGETKKIGIEPYFLLGSTYCYTPTLSYRVQIDNLSFETRNNRTANWAFTYREGLKLNYALGKKTIISVDASYLSSKADAKGLEHIVLGNKNYSRTFEDYTININAMLVGMGISTRF